MFFFLFPSNKLAHFFSIFYNTADFTIALKIVVNMFFASYTFGAMSSVQFNYIKTTQPPTNSYILVSTYTQNIL